MTNPFCPTIFVGITSLDLHKFPKAASAECGPSERVSSKLEIGASGTTSNDEPYFGNVSTSRLSRN